MIQDKQSRSEDRHALGSRIALLAFTSAIILLNSRTLGAAGQGEVAWVQLGILLVTGVSGFLAGGTAVFLQKEMAVWNTLLPGHLWLICSSLVGAGIGTALKFLPSEHFLFIVAAGWMQGAIIFHSQVLLAAQKIKSHNMIQVLQSGASLVILSIFYTFKDAPVLEDFLIALGVSLGISVLASAALVWCQVPRPNKEQRIPASAVALRLWTYGRAAQTGSLLQMLTNRANLSLLAQAPAGVAASGIYSIAFYGLEAIWLVPRALAPLVYTRTASENMRAPRLAHTRKQLKVAMAGSALSLCAALIIPDEVYGWTFGFDGIRPILVGLAPAAIFGAFSSIIAHHLSGIGQHRWNAWTSAAGLATLLFVATALIPTSGAYGAAQAASCAAGVQALGLLFAWSKSESTPLNKLLF